MIFLCLVLQAHRFDPSGDYVRKYVPELAGISGSAVHEPWLLPAADTAAYPKPVIDMSAASVTALLDHYHHALGAAKSAALVR